MSTAPFEQVLIRADAASAELIADLLWAFEPPAIEERADGDRVLLIAGFVDPARAEAAAVALAELPEVDVERRVVGDDGLDAWRAHARIEHAAPFLLIPPWLDPEPSDDGDVGSDPHMIRLVIDPGRAFGSGSHPTTRLVLQVLARLLADRPDATVLDVGCGSGVLAVAAGLVGARHVVAIDVDPAAIDATRANADRNGMGATVSPSLRSLAEVVAAGRRFDLVVANLLAPIVVDLGTDLAAALGCDGVLVVSGLLADRWSDATNALPGCRVVDVITEDGWAAVVLGVAQPPAPSTRSTAN